MSSQPSVQSSVTGSPKPSTSFATSPPTLLDRDIEEVIANATSSSALLSPSSRDTRTQLFVGNLPYRVRWQDLKDLFRKAGTVLRADVSLGPGNRSRGYGSVLLASAEDAKRAVEMFNGFSWQTRTLEVRSDHIPPDLDLSNPINALQFSKAQNSTGPVYPFIPPINGAFVNMDPTTAQMHAKAAAEAQQALGLPVAHPIPPSSLPSVHLSPTLNASGSGRMLFVGNLPFHCQWQELKDLFRPAGHIIRADVALGPDGRSRGFGTVLFANEVDAAAAVAMFNGYEHNGRVLKVHHDKFSSQINDNTNKITSPYLKAQSPVNDSSSNRPSSLYMANSNSYPQQNQLFAVPQPQHYHPATGFASPIFRAFNNSQPGSPYDAYPPNYPNGTQSSALQPHDYGASHQARNPLELMFNNTTPSMPPFDHRQESLRSLSHQQPMYQLYASNPYQQHLYPEQYLQSIGSLQPPQPIARPSDESIASTSPTHLAHEAESFTRSRSDSLVPTKSASGEAGRSGRSHAHPSDSNASRPAASIGANGQAASSPTVPTAGGSSRTAPGTISIPSRTFTIPNPLSPHMTRGIAITPSMPGFTFHAPISTPPLQHPMMSPGLGPFSPGAPIGFFSSYINTAPGAPMPIGPQQDLAHPSSIMGGFSAFGPPTPQAHQIQHMSISMGLPPMPLSPPLLPPLHSPHEYFPMPPPPSGPVPVPVPGPAGSASPLVGYFPHIPSPLSLVPPSNGPGVSALSEPRDYFSGAIPSTSDGSTPSATLAAHPPTAAASVTSTVPSSSQTSSPQPGSSMGSGRFDREYASSRGTSLATDADVEKPEPSPQRLGSNRSSSADHSHPVSQHIMQQRSLSGSSVAGVSSRSAQGDPFHASSSFSHLRAKSQSPAESGGSSAISTGGVPAFGGDMDDASAKFPSLMQPQNFSQAPYGNTGSSSGNVGGERRMSWNDLSGLQRSIAQMSLEGKRDLNSTNARRPRQ